MKKQERILRIKFALTDGLGPRTLHEAFEYCGSLSGLVEAYQVEKTRDLINKKLQNFLKRVDEIDTKNFLSKIDSLGLKYTVLGDQDYPSNLANIYDPPTMLLYKGDLRLANDTSKLISVVGTRGFSIYGQFVTEMMIRTLAEHDYVIVSGLAYGIDAIAHRAALINKAKTIAVLASSADKPTPAGHERLYNDILESGGLVLSEAMPGDELCYGSFPRRNRIIAGLSNTVLVTEAGNKSGALITANSAFAEGRNVLAIPMDITKKTLQGTNMLISREKAKLINSSESLLFELGVYKWGEKRKRESFKLKSHESKIIDILKKDPKRLEELLKLFDNDNSILLASLTELELKGLLKQSEDGRYFYVY